MEFQDVVRARRSVRQYDSTPVPGDVMKRAFELAVLSPNSSNMQTWDYFWVRNPDKKAKLVEACLSQSAARTARELVVVTANPTKWRRAQKPIVERAIADKAPKFLLDYYQKIVPFAYTTGYFNSLAPLKWLVYNTIGLFRPMARGPTGRASTELVAVKSAALSAENFVLALRDQGYDTCMMEGFDEVRVRKICGEPSSTRVVMVIAIGKAQSDALVTERIRLPMAAVVHEI